MQQHAHGLHRRLRPRLLAIVRGTSIKSGEKIQEHFTLFSKRCDEGVSESQATTHTPNTYVHLEQRVEMGEVPLGDAGKLPERPPAHLVTLEQLPRSSVIGATKRTNDTGEYS